MSDDGKFEKGQENVRDTLAEETKEDARDIVAEETKEDVRDIVAEETKEDVRDIVAEDLGGEKYFTNQAKKLRERAAQIVEGDKPPESESPRIEREADTFRQHRVNRVTTEKGKDIFNIMARWPVVTLLVIGAIVLVGIILYAFIQYGNQSYKAEIFNASWNQSLSGLHNGNVSLTEYCNQNPHDQKLCDIFWNLRYM